jgi:Ca-activated chloride channel homolog
MLGYTTTEADANVNGQRDPAHDVDGRFRTIDGVLSTEAPVSRFLSTATQPFSTFAADVDNASWIQAREWIQQGGRPDVGSVRLEEFVNAMPYAYPEPEEDFGVTTELVQHSVRDVHLVRIGVQGRHLDAASRPPLNLTFLVDVSGSMSAADKLPLVQSSLEALTAQLGPEDSVALVTYAGRSGVVLPSTRANGPGKTRILDAIRRLSSGGSTAMGDGISLAYGEAGRHHRPGAVSRVIVASDGDANVGTSSGEQLAQSIRHHADEGIALTVLGVGAGRGKDQTMEMLANKGDGQYFFLGNPEDAERVLVDRLVSTLVPLARDVKLQVEWDAEVVQEYRLLGYDNRRLADADFRNDPVDAGEVGPGHQVTALYAVKLVPGADDQALGVLRLRAKPPGPDAPANETAFVLHGPVATDPMHATVDTTVAMAAASLAGHLRGEELLPLSRAESLLARVVDPSVPEHGELLRAIRTVMGGRGYVDGADAGSGVVSVKVKDVGFNELQVVCGGYREEVPFRGGRAVLSRLPPVDCTATVRGDGDVSFTVVPGASYLCDEAGCRQVL